MSEEEKALVFLGTSVLGSDEIFEMYCETCHRDGKHATASAFCTSCISYFCSTCLDYHGKFLHDHICLFGESMPQDVCTEKCKIHPKEVLKFHCFTCNKFVCSTCKRDDHKSTCDLKYLPDIVNDLEQGNEFKQLNFDWNNVTRKMVDVQVRNQAQQEYTNQIITNVKLGIKTVKDSIFEGFDQEADKIERGALSLMKANQERINSINEKVVSLSQDIGWLTHSITQTSFPHSKERYKMFIKMKEIIPKLAQTEKDVDDLTKYVRSDGSFQNDLKYQGNNLTEKVAQLGKNARQFKANMEVVREERKRKAARFVGDINITTSFDSGLCHIGDCCLLSEQYLIACDKTNSSVKLIDTKGEKVIYVRRIKTIPEAVTKISETTFALVHPYDNDEDRSIIQFLTMINNKFLEFQNGFILTQMYCTNIAYIQDDTFIISMWANHRGKVQVVDRVGCVLANIENNAKNEYLFKCPNYITLDKNGTVLYVSDWYRDCISAIDLDQRAVRVFPHRFWHPEGVTTDHQGFVYVCETGTKRILVFCPDDDAASADVLLEGESDNWQPLAMCYSLCDRKLYVSQYGLNFLKVYEISDG